MDRILASTWVEIHTAYASGIGLREIARNMGLSENPVLARARREKWTEQIVVARQRSKPMHSNAITPMQSAALTMQQRGERYTERMASVSEKVLPHLQSMQPDAILESARNIEQFDRVARRNYGPVNVAILTNRADVQLVSQS